MNKYINPFHTIEEAIEVLQSLDVDPLNSPKSTDAHDDAADSNQSGATYPFPWGSSKAMRLAQPVRSNNFHWQEHILSVIVQITYDSPENYHTCGIHMTKEGFDAIARLLQDKHPVIIAPHLAGYDEHFIEPSPLLRLYKLVSRDETQEEIK